MHSHGYFADPDTGKPLSGPVVFAAWCCDGSIDMILTRPVLYIDPHGRWHTAPAGTRINGLSVPSRVLYPIVSNFEAVTRDGSVVHDAIVCQGMDWVYAAWVFWHAMLAAYELATRGAPRTWRTWLGRKWFTLRAWNRWAGVRYVGIWFQAWHRGRKP